MMHQALLVMESFNYFTQGPWIVIVVFYSNEHNISNGCFFLLGCSHFCLLCKRGRYSFNHLFQKISARYWTCFHLRRDNRSSLWNKPGGIGGLENSSTKWLGVKGCLSGRSLKTVLIGQLFIILSTSHMKVVRLLLLWICSWRRACRIFHMVQMQRSHTPLTCEPWGARDALSCHWWNSFRCLNESSGPDLIVADW